MFLFAFLLCLLVVWAFGHAVPTEAVNQPENKVKSGKLRQDYE